MTFRAVSFGKKSHHTGQLVYRFCSLFSQKLKSLLKSDFRLWNKLRIKNSTRQLMVIPQEEFEKLGFEMWIGSLAPIVYISSILNGWIFSGQTSYCFRRNLVSVLQYGTRLEESGIQPEFKLYSTRNAP